MQAACGWAWIYIGEVLLQWWKPELRAWNCEIEQNAMGVGLRVKMKNQHPRALFQQMACGWALICVGRVLSNCYQMVLSTWDCEIEQNTRGVGFRVKVKN